MTRSVIVYKWEREKGQRHMVKVHDYVATFHSFGSNYEEFEDGAGNYSSAIVERLDGQVENVAVELIKFTDR